MDALNFISTSPKLIFYLEQNEASKTLSNHKLTLLNIKL